MAFCRTFGIEPRNWRLQPADVIVRWRAYLNAEARATEERRELERLKAEARGRRN
jgi:hypothetical protein